MTMNDDGSAGPFFVNFVWYTVWAVIYSVMATFLVVNLAPYAAGSGMPELKTILGGYTIKRVLGIWTLIVKSATLVLAVGSGLCLGKEGPLLHIAACLANIFARLFSKYNRNEGKIYGNQSNSIISKTERDFISWVRSWYCCGFWCAGRWCAVQFGRSK